MKSYYIHNGISREGPFTMAQLKQKKITRNTPLWHAGLSNWVLAGNVHELATIFEEAPPLFKGRSSLLSYKDAIRNGIQLRKEQTVRGSRKIVIALAVIGVCFFLVSFGKNYTSHKPDAHPETYMEKVLTVAEIEQTSPVRFLKAEGTFSKNIWGNKYKINGYVYNNASVTAYKDLLIEVHFYASNETEIRKQSYVVFDSFPAYQKKEFKLKIDRPDACSKLSWNVIGATAY